MTQTKRVMKIMDWVVLILAIFVVIAIAYKITDGNLNPVTQVPSNKSITFELEVYAKNLAMLEHIKVGDQLSSAKRMLDAHVKAVSFKTMDEEVLVVDERRLDHIAPMQAIAYVTVDAQVDVKDALLRLGQQEIRPGMMIFFESQVYKFSSRILRVEE